MPMLDPHRHTLMLRNKKTAAFEDINDVSRITDRSVLRIRQTGGGGSGIPTPGKAKSALTKPSSAAGKPKSSVEAKNSKNRSFGVREPVSSASASAPRSRIATNGFNSLPRPKPAHLQQQQQQRGSTPAKKQAPAATKPPPPPAKNKPTTTGGGKEPQQIGNGHGGGSIPHRGFSYIGNETTGGTTNRAIKSPASRQIARPKTLVPASSSPSGTGTTSFGHAVAGSMAAAASQRSPRNPLAPAAASSSTRLNSSKDHLNKSRDDLQHGSNNNNSNQQHGSEQRRESNQHPSGQTRVATINGFCRSSRRAANQQPKAIAIPQVPELSEIKSPSKIASPEQAPAEDVPPVASPQADPAPESGIATPKRSVKKSTSAGLFGLKRLVAKSSSSKTPTPKKPPASKIASPAPGKTSGIKSPGAGTPRTSGTAQTPSWLPGAGAAMSKLSPMHARKALIPKSSLVSSLLTTRTEQQQKSKPRPAEEAPPAREPSPDPEVVEIRAVDPPDDDGDDEFPPPPDDLACPAAPKPIGVLKYGGGGIMKSGSTSSFVSDESSAAGANGGTRKKVSFQCGVTVCDGSGRRSTADISGAVDDADESSVLTPGGGFPPGGEPQLESGEFPPSSNVVDSSAPPSGRIDMPPPPLPANPPCDRQWSEKPVSRDDSAIAPPYYVTNCVGSGTPPAAAATGKDDPEDDGEEVVIGLEGDVMQNGRILSRAAETPDPRIIIEESRAEDGKDKDKAKEEPYKEQLIKLQQAAKNLREQCDQLKNQQKRDCEEMSEAMRDKLAAVLSKCVTSSVTCQRALRLRRGRADELRHAYGLRAASSENELGEIEAGVEELRKEVVTRRGRVRSSHVERLVLRLSRTGRMIADMKGSFGGFSHELKQVGASEIEVIQAERRFVEHEPLRLDQQLKRCQQLTATLFTLKKLASVQEARSRTPTSGNHNSLMAPPPGGFHDPHVVGYHHDPMLYRQHLIDDIKRIPVDHVKRMESIQALEVAEKVLRRTDHLQKIEQRQQETLKEMFSGKARVKHNNLSESESSSLDSLPPPSTPVEKNPSPLTAVAKDNGKPKQAKPHKQEEPAPEAHNPVGIPDYKMAPPSGDYSTGSLPRRMVVASPMTAVASAAGRSCHGRSTPIHMMARSQSATPYNQHNFVHHLSPDEEEQQRRRMILYEQQIHHQQQIQQQQHFHHHYHDQQYHDPYQQEHAEMDEKSRRLHEQYIKLQRLQMQRLHQQQQHGGGSEILSGFSNPVPAQAVYVSAKSSNV